MLITHGVVATPFEAKQVAASLTPATTTSDDVLVLRSAKPLGAGNVVKSMTRNRRRVTLPPVLLTTLRLISRVPNVELFGGSEVKSLTRLGGFAAEMLDTRPSRKSNRGLPITLPPAFFLPGKFLGHAQMSNRCGSLL